MVEGDKLFDKIAEIARNQEEMPLRTGIDQDGV